MFCPQLVPSRRGILGKRRPRQWSWSAFIYRRSFLCCRRKLKLLTLDKRRWKYMALLLFWQLVWLNWRVLCEMQTSDTRPLLIPLKKNACWMKKFQKNTETLKTLRGGGSWADTSWYSPTDMREVLRVQKCVWIRRENHKHIRHSYIGIHLIIQNNYQ